MRPSPPTLQVDRDRHHDDDDHQQSPGIVVQEPEAAHPAAEQRRHASNVATEDGQVSMDESRYGRAPRWRALAIGLPPAVVLVAVGVYWTLLAWGVLGEAEESPAFSVIGPLVAGFGVALAYVVLRPRR